MVEICSPLDSKELEMPALLCLNPIVHCSTIKAIVPPIHDSSGGAMKNQCCRFESHDESLAVERSSSWLYIHGCKSEAEPVGGFTYCYDIEIMCKNNCREGSEVPRLLKCSVEMNPSPLDRGLVHASGQLAIGNRRRNGNSIYRLLTINLTNIRVGPLPNVIFSLNAMSAPQSIAHAR